MSPVQYLSSASLGSIRSLTTHRGREEAVVTPDQRGKMHHAALSLILAAFLLR